VKERRAVAKILVFLLSATGESAFLLWLSHVGGLYFNEHYPVSRIDWRMVFLMLALAKVGHSFWLVIRFALSEEKKSKK